jgi:ATP-binding cassette, subfamily B (MDR/TAP), member 1
METAAMSWVTRMRKMSFKNVLSQDKKWFDHSANNSVRIVQILIHDGDDSKTLIATVLSQFILVSTMLVVGLVWALVQGWQLSLVGLAIGLVFAKFMVVQSKFVAKCEVRNKSARENISKGYYDVSLGPGLFIFIDLIIQTLSSIRGIRAMSLDHIFQTNFQKLAEEAFSAGLHGAFVEGCTYGVASACIYTAEALLFYVGALLIVGGTYTYLQMVQVLNLVLFSITTSSQLMAFSMFLLDSIYIFLTDLLSSTKVC